MSQKKKKKLRYPLKYEDIEKEGQHEVYIRLNYGIRSSKDIFSDGKGNFEVFNHIDETTQKLTKKELWTKSHIGKALDYNSLYRY
jgi:hypothetical protein